MTGPGIAIRPYGVADESAVIALWQRCGLDAVASHSRPRPFRATTPARNGQPDLSRATVRPAAQVSRWLLSQLVVERRRSYNGHGQPGRVAAG